MIRVIRLIRGETKERGAFFQEKKIATDCH